MGYKRSLDIYIQLERSRQYKESGNMNVLSATTTPPKSRRPKSVLVKVKLIVPDEAFDPATIPAIVADIPLELLHPAQGEVEVQVDDASQVDA